jgi:hypothetical protein
VLHPVETVCPGGEGELGFFYSRKRKFEKMIALRLMIYIDIYKYRSWSSNNHYITLIMIRVT